MFTRHNGLQPAKRCSASPPHIDTSLPVAEGVRYALGPQTSATARWSGTKMLAHRYTSFLCPTALLYIKVRLRRKAGRLADREKSPSTGPAPELLISAFPLGESRVSRSPSPLFRSSPRASLQRTKTLSYRREPRSGLGRISVTVNRKRCYQRMRQGSVRLFELEVAGGEARKLSLARKVSLG